MTPDSDYVPYADLSAELKEAVEARDRYAGDAMALLLSRLSIQLSSWDSLDNKATGVFSVAVAALAIYAAAVAVDGVVNWAEWSVLAVAGLFFGWVFFEASRALDPRVVQVPPDPSGISSQVELAGATRAWMAALGQAIEVNRPVLEEKARRVSWMLRLLAYEAMALAIGSLVSGFD